MRHNLVIPEEIMKEFKVFIVNKQSDIKKGDLSKWVSIAMRNLMREERQHQQHTAYSLHNMSNEEEMNFTLTELMKEIRSILWNDPLNPIDISCGNSCRDRTLKSAISKIRGQDNRTTNKWVRRLIEYRFIGKFTNGQYKDSK